VQIKLYKKIPDEYEALAAKGNSFSPCYAPYYLKLLSAYLNNEPLCFVLKQGAVPLGTLALFVTEGPAGKIANSMPYYGSYGGCLVDPSLRPDDRREVKSKILLRLVEWAEEENIKLITVINHPFEEDEDLYRAVLKPTFQDERVGQVLRLPHGSSTRDPIDLLLQMHKKGRNVVRKGLRLTEVKAENETGAFTFLYETHVKNMYAIGGIPKERSFFDMVYRMLIPGRDYRLYVGYVEGERAAACLTFRYGGVIDYFTPAINQRFRSSQALSAIIMRAMQEGTREGFKWWNWGGTWRSQEGVYRFKARWGGDDKLYKYHIKVLGDVGDFAKIGRNDLLFFYKYFYTLPFGETGLAS